jgi:hypothetical protein
MKTILAQLSAKGFTTAQNQIVVDAFNEFKKNNPEKTNPDYKELAEAANKFIDNLPNIINEYKKPDYINPVFKLVVVAMILGTLLTLSLKGILGTCEASTLFGGVVGYLLGNTQNA